MRRHGLHKTQEYKIWQQMRSRCEWEQHPAYAHYGGRGIKVCERWTLPDGYGVENFIADVGPRPSLDHSIDRIDVNGHYEPGNVRWATMRVQARNRRNNKLEEHEYEQIRWLVSLGNQQKDVAAFFGIGRPFASYIVNGCRKQPPRRSAA